MKDESGNNHTEKGDEIVAKPRLRCIQSRQYVQENQHREKILEHGKQRQTEPYYRCKVSHILKTSGFAEEGDRIIAVKQDLKRRKPAQHFLAVGIVEGTPIDA